mmetsp:Transcript_18560/g.30268  ORF Transcript_18560/g.30268 Transcript_18560/m.30268 type:complete len:178 (-) Transcript_18560:477-1010(-)
MLHGLWPAFSSKRGDKGTYPSDCKTIQSRFEKAAIPPLALDLAPNYHGGLAKHEWKKHGTCSNLPPKLYFEEALRVMLSMPRTDRGTPEIIKKNIGGQVDSSELRKSYVKDVGIKVSNKCVLEEITSCWAKTNKNGLEKVGQQVDCPDYIMKGFRNNCDGKKCKGKIKIAKLGTCEV